MQSCLGLYIEDNLIKYAKVSKNNDNVKVESFGVKFYENIENTIKQIVEETYSMKLPISINSTEEWYNDIYIFSLLKKDDMKNAIKTEFESICDDRDVNKNIYEQRYIFTNAYKGDDKIKVIHMSVPKTSIEQRKNQFGSNKISSVVPLSISISNLIRKDKKGTSIIVNIEKETTVTKITNGSVADVEILNIGSRDILNKINKKENSYFKSYEICKSATIYTDADRDLQYEENEYLEDIMPTLYEIVSKVKQDIDESIEKIENVYITGTGALINNIDIYFQEYLRNVHCEILKPSFINNNSKINIKDYIEVNSAIAIGLQALEKNNREINFKAEEGLQKAWAALNTDIKTIKPKETKQSVNNFLDTFSRQWDMLSITLTLITVLYFAGSYVLNEQFGMKIDEADASITDTNRKIGIIQEYDKKFASNGTRYRELNENIDKLDNAISEDKEYKNRIPNLLNEIMVAIPQEVQLKSIENTSDTHVVIKATTNSFPQMAYFKTKIETDGILKNVVSDTGTAQGGILTVTIEGELP